MNIRHILLFLMLAVVLTCVSCGTSEDYFSYRDGDARLILEGSVRGSAFRAELCRVRDGEGTSDTLRYLSPSTLEGVTLTRDQNGVLTLSMGDLSRVCEADEVEGLLTPMLLLLDAPTDVERVQRTRDGCTCLTLAGGIDLTLSRNGIPLSLVSPAACFQIMQAG